MRRNVILLVGTIVLIVGSFVATILSDNRPELGLDLQGGISIVLFPEDGQDLSTLDTAADIIRQRVEGIGASEPEVSVQGGTIVVDLPGVDDRAQAEQLVGQTAELQFRLAQGFIPAEGVTTTSAAPSTTAPGGSTTTGTGEVSSTTAAPSSTTAPAGGESLGTTIDTQPIAAVRPAQETTTTGAGATTTTGAAATTTTAAGGSTTTTTVAARCEELVTPRDEVAADQPAVFWDADRTGCYQVGPTLLTGSSIGKANAEYDPQVPGWVVAVEFRNDDFITKVAQPNVGNPVAIVLDDEVQSAPVINEGITGRDVQITGNFTQGEAEDLALVLRYGSLPIKFDPEEQTSSSVSPTLGKDQLHAGIVAGLIGLGFVAIYMILYYRLLGLVVWLGLALTALFFFALVSYLSANGDLTLTLAGVTGIIVSVGVTVDSYVVYFERLKDEVRTGKTVRSSLDSGFARSFRTIVAADLVSLLGAVVLYLLAAGNVRGFAFFLGISTTIDLVLAYFFMHPLVSLMARRPALVRMRGIGIASGLDVPGVRA